ncbi:MAG TPA: glutamate 5-kinase, partial [Gammaproteobacteria bacterium]|nr:glutamate 5-kinase [Gammaproteobacteria bacterium]
MNSHSRRTKLSEARRLVVKIGSSSVTQEGSGLAGAAIHGWAEQMARLIEDGRQIVLVSSGAVAAGMSRLGWKQRPHELHNLQAAAAIGQMGLVQSYESTFKQHNLLTAQVLLSHDDLADRQRYLNARSTLITLLQLKTVPIVNENDTVATEEIRFGDNDSLAAMVTNLVEADLLIILTDQQGLYDSDPRSNPEARLLPEADCGDPSLEQMAGGSHGSLGRGGMLTKLHAARTAARSGADTIIMSSHEQNGLLRALQGESLGTLLYTQQEALTARKQWLAGRLVPKGAVVLDNGAIKVLRESGRSLLPVGVMAVK